MFGCESRGIADGIFLRWRELRILPMSWIKAQGNAMDRFGACFSALEDPRAGNALRHDLAELLVIALCTVLCGGESCVDMADFAEEKEPFLREFLSLDNGLPSHDTFSRVFRALAPDQFRRCFQDSWLGLPRPARGSSRSTARFCAGRSKRNYGDTIHNFCSRPLIPCVSP